MTGSGEKWRFRHANVEYGPYSVDALKDVLRSASIDSDVELRRETERQWVRVTSVNDILAASDLSTLLEPTVEPARHSASSSSAKPSAASKSSDHGSSKKVDPAPHTERPRQLQAASFARGSSSSGASKKIAIAAALVVWLGGNAIAVYDLYFGDLLATERRYASTLHKIWKDLGDLAARKASDEDWDAFRKQTMAELTPIIRDLESSADQDHPARQHLLWAARDTLPKMLYKTDRDRESLTTVYWQHMNEVRRQLSDRQ